MWIIHKNIAKKDLAFEKRVIKRMNTFAGHMCIYIKNGKLWIKSDSIPFYDIFHRDEWTKMALKKSELEDKNKGKFERSLDGVFAHWKVQ